MGSVNERLRLKDIPNCIDNEYGNEVSMFFELSVYCLGYNLGAVMTWSEFRFFATESHYRFCNAAYRKIDKDTVCVYVENLAMVKREQITEEEYYAQEN